MSRRATGSSSYHYAGGRVTGGSTVSAGCRTPREPDLHGAYAHALKSVAIGRDGSLFFSVGSSGNVSPADRSANPQRATIMQIPPGGSKATVYARGVRNGTGLAFAPDDAVWTAVNNRDNAAYPYDRDYDGDGKSDVGKVMTGYVNEHPLEPMAQLFAGRDLGWPYCNPDPDVNPGVKGTALTFANRPFVRDIQLNPTGSHLELLDVAQDRTGSARPLRSAGHELRPGRPARRVRAGALIGVHGSWNRNPPRAARGRLLRRRHGIARQPADAGHRLAALRRQPLGPAGDGVAGQGQGDLHQRRRGRRDLPARAKKN